MKLLEKPAKFFSDVSLEMSKVSWPTYEELKQSTKIVILISMIFVVFTYFWDLLLNEAVKVIFR